MSLSLSDFTRLTALAAVLRQSLVEVYPLLSTDWVSLSEISQKTSLDRYIVRLHCEAMKHFDLVELNGTMVRLKENCKAIDALAWTEILDYYSTFAARRLPVQVGQTAGVGDYYGMLEAIAQPTTEFMLQRYGKAKDITILDYGCGLAPHTRALLETNSDISAKLVDRLSILRLTRELIERSNFGHRVHYIEWSSFLRAPAEEYKLIFLINVLHELTSRDQGLLVRELCRRLSPDGELLIQVFCRDLQPDWHADALEMATAIRLGTRSAVLPVSRYLAWLRHAGIRSVEKLDLLTPAGKANITLIARKDDRND